MLKTNILLFVSLVMLPFFSWATKDLVQIPGTSVSMPKPDGFELSDTFAGYLNAKNSSSVVVMELPLEAFGQLSALFGNLETVQQSFAKQGVKVNDVTLLEMDGYKAPVVIGEQAVSGVSVDKYIALFKGQKTVMVTYNLMDTKTFNHEKVMASIKSIEIGKAASLSDKLALLSFTFQPEKPFNVADVMGNSTVSLTTFEGIDKSGEKPVLMIGSSMSKTRFPEPSKHATALIKSLVGFENLTITSESKVKFAESEGYKIVAKAEGKTAIQFVGYTKTGTYIRLVSVGNSEEMSKVEEKVNAIAKSVVPKS
ncbi:hypothetical protein TUMSATVNIG1_49800 [Vibrio nigripulchritudo]|uniref:hypothetical protein n=1 Tax=Vibrio nigripulchritudo TaxID=28173 RepID=UPI00190ABBBF|nr:hypothetical protein [Vibrio nigripulchritudo]BCL73007.1 hypothetical protein VNTUMSATTG_49440 [Vibrio nigripulchritudo]BDU34371.1 hypothetical protein TUMSATVNIG1_49800 [Vibrio nigripulchritudo]